MAVSVGRRLRRLAEELEESGVRLPGGDEFQRLLLEEIDLALRPPVHETRVASSGTIIDPLASPPAWSAGTHLEIVSEPLREQPLGAARRFTDGLSSWLLRRAEGSPEWAVFDRPAGSERDLVVLAGALEATLVQRHPAGVVRVVGDFGVLRWAGLGWRYEPPIHHWIDLDDFAAPQTMKALLGFAVHDLGSAGIGSILIVRPAGVSGPPVEEVLPLPPALHVDRPAHLAPLRHALGQVDGAAIFDSHGVLQRLGVRLVPSRAAEASVAPSGGTRHTAARRYSRDDPLATVVVVSDDGPVSVFRDGEVIGRSHVA